MNRLCKRICVHVRSIFIIGIIILLAAETLYAVATISDLTFYLWMSK